MYVCVSISLSLSIYIYIYVTQYNVTCIDIYCTII